jgi:hypothetical protein
MTERDVIDALRPTARLSFDEEVRRRAAISLALRTLKSEHRAWPTKTTNGTRRWNITTKGRRTY